MEMTCNFILQTWVSTSSIETTFFAAAARNLPTRGWNLIQLEPPYIMGRFYTISAWECISFLIQIFSEIKVPLLNLDNPHTAATLDAPIPDLNVIITGADEIIFPWMEVQGCNRKRMSSESSKGKVRLQIGILNIINVCKMDLCVHSSQMFQYKEENAFHKQSMQSTDQKCFRRLCYFWTG